MPDNERNYSPEQKAEIQDKINRAIDSEVPDMAVKRSDGKIEKGWIPYDLTLDNDPESPDRGKQIVHFAKVKENPEDGYDLKAMYDVDVERAQAEVEEIEESTEHMLDDEAKKRARAIRMSGAYQRLQERIEHEE